MALVYGESLLNDGDCRLRNRKKIDDHGEGNET